MNIKKWLLGVAASLVLSALVAGSTWVVGADWRVLVAAFCTSAVTHLGAWMKQHPVESVVLNGNGTATTTAPPPPPP